VCTSEDKSAQKRLWLVCGASLCSYGAARSNDHQGRVVGVLEMVSEPYKDNTTLTAIFLKTYGEDTLQCTYKDYSSLNRWQANRDLISIFTFYNLFSAMTHLR
jgi:hypothetical protein